MSDGKNPEISTSHSPKVSRGVVIAGLAATVASAVLPETSYAQDLFPSGSPKPVPPKSTERPSKPVSKVVVDLNPPDLLNEEEAENSFTTKVFRLEEAAKLILPDFAQRPRTIFETGSKEYSIYSTDGKIEGKGILPTIQISSPQRNKMVLEYSALRVAEEMAGIFEEVKGNEVSVRMVDFYQDNLGRNFNEDLEEFASILEIDNYASKINEDRSREPIRSVSQKAYRDGFSRIWMEPKKFKEKLHSIESTELRARAANFALAIIWSTVDCSTSPATFISLGFNEQLVNDLTSMSGKQEEWQRILKKAA
jgi:hypothetical protein